MADNPTGLVWIEGEGGLRAAVNPQGAELWRWLDPEGRDLLWDGDPAVWTGRAPVLFPMIGCLNRGRYRWRGREYAMPKHGFARHSRWESVAHGARSATFRLAANEATRPIYPFEFVLDLTFALSAHGIAMTASLDNRGAEPMPFNFGFHPALRWPLPGGAARGDYRLQFDVEEAGTITRIDGDGLVARVEPSPVKGRELVLDDRLFDEDALILRGLGSRGVFFGGATGRNLRCDFPSFPDLGIWTKPGAGYLCIEPWLGFADPAGFDGDIFDKPGIGTLAPGQRWQGMMRITLARPAR